MDADIHTTPIWEGVGFDRSSALKIPTNTTLMPLPLYSQELNGIENLWHDLRSHCWSNRAYAGDDELLDVISATLRQHCLNPQLIKSVCASAPTPTSQRAANS